MRYQPTIIKLSELKHTDRDTKPERLDTITYLQALAEDMYESEEGQNNE